MPDAPEDLEAILQDALGLYRSGQFLEALQRYEQAQSQQPSHRCHHGRGDCLFAMGRIKESVAAFRDALQLSPRYFRSHLNLALALQQLGRKDEAGFHARQADRYKPGDPYIQSVSAQLSTGPAWQDVAVAATATLASAGPAAEDSMRRALLVYPAAQVADSSQTTNVYQAWGLLLRRAFEAAGWLVDSRTPAEAETGAAPEGGGYAFALLLDYSGDHIARLVSALRRQALVVAYFNESASGEYVEDRNDASQPDLYYQASLCLPGDFDFRSSWVRDERVRIVPAFRTLASAEGVERQAVLINGPLPPRYAIRFSEQIRRGTRYSVDANALVRRVRSSLPASTAVFQLLPDFEHELERFSHQGSARPYGLPEWRVEPLAGVTTIEPMAIDGLRPLLSRCAQYVVTHQESYGGLVLDALSMGATVHYPCHPLMRSCALVAMRTELGFRPSQAPQLRPYTSLDELLLNLGASSAQAAELLEPASLAAQMATDCARLLATRAVALRAAAS